MSLLFLKSWYQEAHSFLRISFPVVLTQLAYAGSGFVGVMMIGRLGQENLAASALGVSIFFALMSFCWGFLSIVSVFVSQYFGAKQPEKIASVISHHFLIALVLGLVVMCLLWLTPFFLVHLQENVAVIHLTHLYLFALAWSVIPDLLIWVLEQTAMGVLRGPVITISTLSFFGLTILFNYIFVFGKWGVHPMGIAGLGWARTVSFWLIFFLLALYMTLSRFFKHLKIFSGFKQWSLKFIKEILRLGIPAGLNSILILGYFMTITLMMGHFGVETLAANGILLQFLDITIMILFGFSQAATILVGHAVGAADHQRLVRVVITSVCVSWIVVFILDLCFWLAPERLLSLDLNIHDPHNQALIVLATSFLALMGIFQLFNSVRIVLGGVLKGLKDTHYLMWQSFVTLWVFALPLGALLSFVFHWEGSGLLWALILSGFLGSLASYLRVRRLIKLREVRA